MIIANYLSVFRIAFLLIVCDTLFSLSALSNQGLLLLLFVSTYALPSVELPETILIDH